MYRMLMLWHDDNGKFRAAIIQYEDVDFNPFDEGHLGALEPNLQDMHSDGMCTVQALPFNDYVPEFVFDDRGDEPEWQYVTYPTPAVTVDEGHEG